MATTKLIRACVVETAGPNHDQLCKNSATHRMWNGQWLCDEHYQYVLDWEQVQQTDPDGALAASNTLMEKVDVIHARIRELMRKRDLGALRPN